MRIIHLGTSWQHQLCNVSRHNGAKKNECDKFLKLAVLIDPCLSFLGDSLRTSFSRAFDRFLESFSMQALVFEWSSKNNRTDSVRE
jgi:hypothetical protein